MTPGLIDLIPPSGIPIGPFELGFYGLSYVLAVLVLLWVTGKEARRRGIDPQRVNGALVTVAICALIGARLYHVIDEWAYYATDLAAIVLPPYSGLGLYGGIAGAIVGIAIEARRHRVPLWTALDVVVPGHVLRPGDRALGQLLQPGAVRPADGRSVGASASTASTASSPTIPVCCTRRRPPASIRCSCTSRSSTLSAASSR